MPMTSTIIPGPTKHVEKLLMVTFSKTHTHAQMYIRYFEHEGYIYIPATLIPVPISSAMPLIIPHSTCQTEYSGNIARNKQTLIEEEGSR